MDGRFETDGFDATHDLTDRFEAQIRPLVRAVREAVEVQIFSDEGSASVGTILQDAPTDACVRLADAWGVADLVGVSANDLMGRFDPIDRFVIEMVTGIYADSKAALFATDSVSVFDTGRFAQPA
jgi:hypothetical protein